MSKINKSNLIDFIIEHESGALDDDDTIEFFQYLIDTGLAWSLQGHYGRAAQALIEGGYCLPANVVDAEARDVPEQLEAGDD